MNDTEGLQEISSKLDLVNRNLERLITIQLVAHMQDFLSEGADRAVYIETVLEPNYHLVEDLRKAIT